MDTVTFHHFTSLPLELRQRIWELSMEPRRVPVGRFPYDLYNTAPPPPRVSPPAILQVHTEARSYLERFYSKAFVTDSGRYKWINFDMDTIFIRQRNIPKFPAELASIRHLSIEINDGEYFYQYLSLEGAKLLEDLELRPLHASHQDWFLEWDPYLHMCYYNDHPVRYRTVIICPTSGHPIPELNPDNYLKVRRDRVRRRLREDYDDWELEFPSLGDSDDEAPCEPGWRHAPGCACPPALRWAHRLF